VGRTGCADLTGEAYTFVAPEDEEDLRAIERAIGKPLPRVLLPDFDYRQKAPEAPPAPPRHSSRPPGRQGDHRRGAGPSRTGGHRRAASPTLDRLRPEAGHGRRPARSFGPRRGR
jgi:ATP-dependent RNA helicase RhlE